MIRKFGYTLVELLVVIAIIGLLAAFGIPAFAKYGRVTEATQKAEEIRELFNQVHSLAVNPENTNITSYRIYYDNSTEDKNFYTLKSCIKNVSDDCSGSVEIRRVDLLKEQSINFSDGLAWLVDCKTKLADSKTSCTNNTGNTIIDIFSDHNSNVDKKFNLVTVLEPYSVKITTSNIE